MRKNKMMRLASGLLVAVLLTTSAISGTFAKYVTSDSASDTARVAKWGISVQASGNLFGTDYAANEALENADSIVAESVNVNSSNTNSVVAPGTKNEEGFTISVTGTPEVAYTITADTNEKTIEDIFLAKGSYGVMVKATGLNAATKIDEYYILDGTTYTKADSYVSTETYYELQDAVEVEEDYYPVNWTVASGGNATAIATKKDLKAISTAMLDGIAADGEANDNAYAKYVLTWAWPFESGNDGADTILGNLIVNEGILNDGSKVVKADGANYTSALTNGTDYNLDVVFGLAVTVTQVN